MRKLLLAMTAVSGLAIAAPAAAQYNQGYQYDRNQPRTDAEFNARLDQRIDMIEARLEAGIDAGELDRNEVRNLRAQIRTLNRLHRDYAANGLTARERQELTTRLRTLRQEIRIADGGAYDRDRRYGSNDDWNDDGVYGNGGVYSGRGGPYDSDGDGWDDRDCDRDGDIDSGSCTTTQQRPGLGGFLDTILGNGGLRVGQRVTGDLYAVPSHVRDRYRDDSRFYYRSDGRRIYQIDTRTDVVTRIYAMP
jgi:hypothetical protein